MENMNSLSLNEKIGQMICIGFLGKNPNDDHVKTISKQIEASELGSILIMGYNIDSKSQISKLNQYFHQLDSPLPLIISIDQEGGKVARFKKDHGFDEFPSHMDVANNSTPDEAYNLYKRLSRMLKEAGVNLNFAPVVDLNINPQSPAIGFYGRSFSDDPKKVVEYAKAMIQAHQDNQVLTCIKHFPGHGSSQHDSHLGITDVTDTWLDIELLPYQELIHSNSLDMVMTAHIFNKKIDPNYPATMSKIHIQNQLRNKFNYQGTLITDDLHMGAINKNYPFEDVVIQSILAGNDILLFSNYPDFTELDHDLPIKVRNIILTAIDQGIIDERRIDQSYQRIVQLKSFLSSSNQK